MGKERKQAGQGLGCCPRAQVERLLVQWGEERGRGAKDNQT